MNAFQQAWCRFTRGDEGREAECLSRAVSLLPCFPASLWISALGHISRRFMNRLRGQYGACWVRTSVDGFRADDDDNLMPARLSKLGARSEKIWDVIVELCLLMGGACEEDGGEEPRHQQRLCGDGIVAVAAGGIGERESTAGDHVAGVAVSLHLRV